MIEPLPGIVYLDIKEVKAGALDTSSRQSAVEYAEVLAIGDGVRTSENGTQLKVGDKVFVKAWAIDQVNHEDKKYFFCNINSGGILAKANDI